MPNKKVLKNQGKLKVPNQLIELQNKLTASHRVWPRTGLAGPPNG
jgi:hypothetical protein